MPDKTCFKCNVIKPLGEFYPHEQMADGHLNRCKECTKIDVRARRVLSPEKIAVYERERAKKPHRVALATRVTKEYRAANPDRYKANIAVNNAIRDGRLKKQPCWVCGEKAVAHHPDYSEPLDVVWLCYTHHKQAHAIAA